MRQQTAALAMAFADHTEATFQRADHLLLQLREAWLAKNTPKPAQPIRHSTSHDPNNADAALLLLGIATRDPTRAGLSKDREQLLLEPWAAQAALRRRRGGQRLTDRETSEVRRCTRDPDSLRWPRGTGE